MMRGSQERVVLTFALAREAAAAAVPFVLDVDVDAWRLLYDDPRRRRPGRGDDGERVSSPVHTHFSEMYFFSGAPLSHNG